MGTARDRLGHPSILVTSALYAGVVDALGRDAAQKAGRLLGTQEGPVPGLAGRVRVAL